MNELSEEERMIQSEACAYIVANKDELIKRFILSKRPLRLGFSTIFMAGSPGAGKTEFSQRYMPLLDKNDPDLISILKKVNIKIEDVDSLMIRIDVDEIRSFLPQYRKTDPSKGTKGNSQIVQKAANKGLDILREYCLENEISFIHDGTFANLDTMRSLIKKSLANDRGVHIFYIYIDPLSAWAFTKAREQLEGRNIVKEKFIEQYFSSKANVEIIKQEFGSKIRLNIVLKAADNKVISSDLNEPSLDSYLKTQYSKGTLREYSPDELAKLIS